MKTCTKCKIEKPLTEFKKNKRKKDGFDIHCRTCVRKYYLENQKSILENKKNYWTKNKEKLKEKKKKYYDENKDRIIQAGMRYQKRKKKVDPVFKLKKNYYRRIHHVLGTFKDALFILGLPSWEDFMVHLEQQFEKNQGNKIMTRENQGSWQVDHRIPLDSADTKEEIIKLLHFSNCQPLWKEDNQKKGCKKWDYQSP